MSEQTQKRYFGLQNLGWLDRIIRFMISAALITGSIMYLSIVVAPVWAQDGATASWPYWGILVGLYVLYTAVVGQDPIYRIFGIKTCGTSPRNPCGTFPYEMEAAAGMDPKPRDDVEHSVSNTRGHTPVHNSGQ